jgi:hypothetical protein
MWWGGVFTSHKNKSDTLPSVVYHEYYGELQQLENLEEEMN